MALVIGFSCGGDGTGQVTPNGDEICLGDRSVCLNVPANALTRSVVVRISPGTDAPPAARSESFNIASTDGKPVKFAIPATVSIKLDQVDANDVPSDTLLRIYTRDPETQEWVPLDAPFINRVRGEITGQTTHLSPFLVLRADQLPDGTWPIELDAGVHDASVVVIPRIPDAGVVKVDAGPPPVDAGALDAGSSVDASVDAGMPDAGDSDAGAPQDAGAFDAGQPDAGESDGG